ncbi:hypothetical protein BCR35DRAFT_354130 [Leucosporidium creatinivorum]|uniref:Uncharacterized protein n=1 Tax=Leucosporidium creatinivorum TaxID=106004 RepID=A0A1Y2EPJ7_9BASI|nr:hypothetical protein BCR35DRAFT_354130 [Leucosporidium creatinivorum]
MATVSSSVAPHWQPRTRRQLDRDLSVCRLSCELTTNGRPPPYAAFLARTLSQSMPIKTSLIEEESKEDEPSSPPTSPRAPRSSAPPPPRPRGRIPRFPSPSLSSIEAPLIYPTPEDYFDTSSTSYTPAMSLEDLLSAPFVLPRAIPDKGIRRTDWETLWIEMSKAWQSKARRGEEEQLEAVKRKLEQANGGWFAKLNCDVYLELANERLTCPSPRPFRLTQSELYSSSNNTSASSSTTRLPWTVRPALTHMLSDPGSIISFNTFFGSSAAPARPDPSSREAKRAAKEQVKVERSRKKEEERVKKEKMKEEEKKVPEGPSEEEERIRRRDWNLARIVVVQWQGAGAY